MLLFSINPPFWGVGQVFDDPVLDSPLGRQEGIDDVRDGGLFYISLSDLKTVDEPLFKIIVSGKNVWARTNSYLKGRGFTYSAQLYNDNGEWKRI